MDPWFSKSLGDAMLADGPLAKLRDAFLAESTHLPGAAIYLRHESEGRLHCELIAYLSPACTVLASEVGARPCARPTSADLSLFIGKTASDLDRSSGV